MRNIILLGSTTKKSATQFQSPATEFLDTEPLSDTGATVAPAISGCGRAPCDAWRPKTVRSPQAQYDRAIFGLCRLIYGYLRVMYGLY